jgi:invasion protein IalB
MFKKLAFILFCSSSLALSETPKLVSSHGDWSVYQYTEGKNQVCYLSSKPSKSEGKYKQRGEVRFLVTLSPGKEGGTVNLVAGYTYQPNGDVTLKLGEQKFTLFTKDDSAWAIDDATDKKIVIAMTSGKQLIAEGKSDKGTETKDSFSLKGFSDAYKAATAACK